MENKCKKCGQTEWNMVLKSLGHCLKCDKKVLRQMEKEVNDIL